MDLLIFSWIDVIGTAVFAISGTLLAHKKQLDGFGVIVLASMTAIGGGTVRDLILDLPVFWLQQTHYIWVIAIASGLSILWLNRHQHIPQHSLVLLDAVGLAFFAIMGTQKALATGLPIITAVMMGTITGVFGGIIRDVLAQEVPLVLKGELYATTCIAGATVYCLLMQFTHIGWLALSCGMLTVLLLRLGAIYRQWHLRVFRYPHH